MILSAEEWALPFDIEEVMQEGSRLMEEYTWDESAVPAEFHGLLSAITRNLQSYDLVDLAWIRPEAEAMLTALQASPWGEPYASWLLQRMDYLDMAHAVLRSYFKTQEPLRPARTGDALLTAPDRSPPAALRVPPEDKPVMQKPARNPVNWDRKLATRAKPARADALVAQLKPIFIEEGIPPELIWLAEVESTFNPQAQSPVGAKGLFQFMPATAQQYGLKLAPVDERTDPGKSARAAARYLKYLHRKFDSWPLALAAYNAGEGRVGRLLRTHQARSFEDIVDYLPAETQMYVPKVLATIRLREGAELASYLRPRKMHAINPKIRLLNQLARAFDMHFAFNMRSVCFHRLDA